MNRTGAQKSPGPPSNCEPTRDGRPHDSGAYAALLAALPHHVLRLDSSGQAVTLKAADSPKAPQPQLSWTPQDVALLVPPDAARRLIRITRIVVQARSQRVLEYTHGDVQFEARVVPDREDRVLVIIRDLTERNAMKDSLRQAQKLEALGRLAAGVAHEINTPIQFVAHNTEFMSSAFATMHELLLSYRQALSSDQPMSWQDRNRMLAEAESTHDLDFLLGEVPAAVAETLEGVRRVAAIVRAMKTFSHPSAAEMSLGDVNQAVRNAVVVSTSEHKLIADVHLDLADLPPVPCVMGELTQVFLNLVVNAAHALEETVRERGERGQITIGSHLDGDDVVVSVSDDGPGISLEAQELIFDPFFTTKDVGKGTGQGLALSRAIIVEKHGGTLTVDSMLDEYTTFTVRLPARSKADAKGGHGEDADTCPASQTAHPDREVV